LLLFGQNTQKKRIRVSIASLAVDDFAQEHQVDAVAGNLDRSAAIARILDMTMLLQKASSFVNIQEGKLGVRPIALLLSMNVFD
jgi:hypothetical protein